MITFVEELLVLLIDEDRGDLISLPERTLNYTLAGAVLLELARAYRVDTDATSVSIVDTTPLGDDLLDPILADLVREINSRPESGTPEFWVRRVAQDAEALRDKATARLVSQGILEVDESGLLSLSRFVFRSRRYSAADWAQQEIRLRLMGILFGNDLPGPRDAAIISLANACGVFQRMLSADEYEAVCPKIDLYARLDRVGRAVANAIRVVTVADSQAQRRAIRQRGGDWPRVAGLPLLGNGLQIRKGLINLIAEQYPKLGPVFELQAFKSKFIVMAGPEANLFLLREGKNHFRSRDQWLGFHDELGAAQSLVSMDGADHFQMRSGMRHGYSRGLIENRLEDAIAILNQEIDLLPLDRDLPVFKTFQLMVSELIGVLSGGMSSRAYHKDLVTFLDALLMVHLIRTSPRIRLLTPSVRRARRRCHDFFEEVLAEHDPDRRSGCPNRDLVDDLLEMHRTTANLVAETDMWLSILNPFIVGLHTVAATVSYLLYSIVQYPDVLARLQAEADRLFTDGPPTAAGVRSMTSTLYATMETLRLYPVVPGITRAVTNSFDFAGYRIPAGATVMIATPVTNRLPEFFPDPDRFDIDRFSPERRRQHARPGVFAPFGLGTHSCLGQGFSQVLIPLVTAGFLHRREVAMTPAGYRIKSKHYPLPRPDDRFRMRLRHRS